MVTIFLGCGFAAKYREGGGNFSVPLQWMLGLRRLRQDAIWLELLPATNDPRGGRSAASRISSGSCAPTGWPGRYCLLYQDPAQRRNTISRRCAASAFPSANCASGWPGRTFSSTSRYSFHPPFLPRVRAPDFLRSRPERDFLLDDENRDGPERIITSSGRSGSMCTARRLPAAGFARSPGALFIRWPIPNCSRPQPRAAPAEIHDDRAMVLGRERGGGWRISRPLEEARLRALPRSARAACRRRAGSWR